MQINLRCEDETDITLIFAAQEAADYLGRMIPDACITIFCGDLPGKGMVTACKAERSENMAEGSQRKMGESGNTTAGSEKAIVRQKAIAGDIEYDGLCILLKVIPDDIKTDHFDIRICDNAEESSITGNHSRSVLMGVYHYLYLLGCRFLGPGREMESVPVLTDTNLLYQQIFHTASYYHRGVCIEGSESLENVLNFIDWLPKMGYNAFFIQFQIPYTFLARWYHHEGNFLARPEEFTPQDAIEYTDTMVAELRKRDLLLQQVGHGWTGESIGIPSMDWKESSHVLTDKQRSMLAQVGGKREFYHGIPMNTNLCYSKPEVVDGFSESVVRYAADHPEVDYLHVWLADECNNICECEECQKSTPTDQYIHILNEIDSKLTEKGLNTRIVFLLYQELLWPPKNIVLEHPERFVLMFAPISRSFNSSYQISGVLPAVPAYERNHITLPVNLDQNLTYLKAWQKYFDGDSFVYDYHLGRAHYGDFGYVHISRIINEDIARLRELRLNGQISCQELRAGMPNFLPNYVMGRKLMDESCTFEELVDEYFRAAYGEDWKEVYKYLSALSMLCSCDYFNGKGSRENPEIAERMKKARRLTDEFAASDYFKKELQEPVHEQFQRMLQYHCRYIVYLEDAMGALAVGRMEEAKENWNQFIYLISENEPEFQPYLDVYRIGAVSLNFTGFRQYCGCGVQQ